MLQNKLIEDEQRVLAAMIDSAVDPIFIIDTEGVILKCNQACSKLFGYTNEEMVNNNITMIMTEEHAINHHKYLHRYLNSENKTQQTNVVGKGRNVTGKRKDGSNVPLHLSVSEYILEERHGFIGIMRDMTAEVANREEQQILSAMIESAIDPIFVIDTTGVIQKCNQACFNIFGYTKDEMIGNNITMIMPEHHACQHHNYLENYLQNPNKTSKTSVVGFGRDVLGKHKNGSSINLHLSVSEFIVEGRHGFIGIMRDMTAEFAKKQEQIVFTAMIESAADPIVVIDTLGIIQKCNKACFTVFGYKAEEMIGFNITILMPEAHACKHHEYLERYLKNPTKSSTTSVVGKGRDVVGKRKDGTTLPIHLSVSEFIVSGRHGFIGIMRDMTDKENAIQAEIERKRSEDLLLNVLPLSISRRLRSQESHESVHIADHYDSVGILFADIVGFTDFASERSPAEVVSLLNRVFRGFDNLVDKFDLEKIKTIGDAYMAVSGLNNDSDHVYRLLLFAQAMLDMVDQCNKETDVDADYSLKIRIGINCGSVVAGVVGSKRRFFDLWGDAVNVASRMESTGISNCIQCTKAVADVAKKYPKGFVVVPRGVIKVKGKGDMDVYLIGREGDTSRLNTVLRQHTLFKKNESIIVHKRLTEELGMKAHESDGDENSKKSFWILTSIIIVCLAASLTQRNLGGCMVSTQNLCFLFILGAVFGKLL